MGHGALSSEGRPDGQLQRMGEIFTRKQPAQGQPRSGEAEGDKTCQEGEYRGQRHQWDSTMIGRWCRDGSGERRGPTRKDMAGATYSLN